jgi:hypothetical protein
MKFLLQNNSVSINVAKFTVRLKVFLNYFICYVARAPNTIPNRPKVSPPISLRKFWLRFLQPAGRSTFQAFNNVANVQRCPVFDVPIHVVFANNTFKDLDILLIANLLHKLTASLLDVALQNFISIFCNPNYVGSKPRYCMATNSLFFTHKVKIAIYVATESLALKAHSFN